LKEWLPLTERDAKKFGTGSVSSKKFGAKDRTPGFGKSWPIVFSLPERLHVLGYEFSVGVLAGP